MSCDFGHFHEVPSYVFGENFHKSCCIMQSNVLQGSIWILLPCYEVWKNFGTLLLCCCCCCCWGNSIRLGKLPAQAASWPILKLGHFDLGISHLYQSCIPLNVGVGWGAMIELISWSLQFLKLKYLAIRCSVYNSMNMNIIRNIWIFSNKLKNHYFCLLKRTIFLVQRLLNTEYTS